MAAEPSFDEWVASHNLTESGTETQGAATLRVMQAKDAPEANGWLPASVWDAATALPFIYRHGRGGKPQASTRMQAATACGWFFAHVVCQEPDAAHLVYASTGRDSPNLWRDDCVEIFLRVGEQGTGAPIQFIVNPIGAWLDMRDGKDEWDPRTRIRTQAGKDSWVVDLAVPLADLIGDGKPEMVWRTNFTRSRKGRDGAFSEETAWRTTGSGKNGVFEKGGLLWIEALKDGTVPEAKALEKGPAPKPLPPERMAAALAGKFKVPSLALSVSEAAPNLGQGLDDPAWAKASEMDIKPLRNVAGRTALETKARLLRLRDRLAIAFQCAEPGTIDARKETPTKDLWKDDCVEIYLAPDRKESASYRHIIVNAEGAVYTGRGRGAESVAGIEVKAFKTAGAWSVVVMVPYEAAGTSAERLPSLWGCNFIRNRAMRAGEPAQTYAWSSPGAWSYHDPGRFGCVWFADAAPPAALGTPEELEAWALQGQAQPVERPGAAMDWNVFTAKEREASEMTGMVARSLKRRLDEQFAQLDQRLYGARDWESWLKTREEFRKTFKASVGLPESKSPLNPRTSVVTENDELRVERLIFESQPGFYVTANCFVPKLRNGKKVPAVVRVVGHSTAGRLGNPLAFGEALARKGYFALVMDALGQGERIYHNNGFGSRTPTSNHYGLGAPCVLTNSNLAGYMVNDVMRAIDYLETREEVDPSRMVMTGESGGGTLTSYVAALDDRLAAAAPVSALDSYRRGGGNYDSEQVLFDEVLGGFESESRCAVMAPKPLIVIREAPGDEAEGRAWCERIKKVYALKNAADRFEYRPTQEPHGYGAGHARIFHEWLAHVVPPNPDAVRAQAPLTYHRDDCRVVSGSSVFFSAECSGAATVFSLNTKRADKPLSLTDPLPPAAEAEGRAAAWKKALRSLLVLPEQAQPYMKAETKARLEFQGFPAEKIALETEPSVQVPAILLLPVKKDRCPAVILLAERGKQPLLSQVWTEVRALLEGGVAVFVPDLRGIGETATDDDTTHMGEETTLNGYGFRIGRPLLGLRVSDAMACAAYLRGRDGIDASRVGIAGFSLAGFNPREIRQPRLSTDAGLEELRQGESLGPAIALLAFALDEKLDTAATFGALASYQDVCRKAYMMHPVGAFVPGILKQCDVAEICAASAPRRLVMAGSVTAHNQVLAAGDEGAVQLERARAWCERMKGTLELNHQGTRKEMLERLRVLLTRER